METTKDLVAAVGDSVAAEDWVVEFEAGFARIAGRFARVEPRRKARAFLLGLLSDVDTRSCWQLAEQAGDRTPHRMQPDADGRIALHQLPDTSPLPHSNDDAFADERRRLAPHPIYDPNRSGDEAVADGHSSYDRPSAKAGGG